MPRTSRVLIDDGYYHIVTRGIDRRRLFRTSSDYRYFLKTAKDYLGKFKVDIVHYCLMTNHIHILVRAAKAADLPKFMQGLLQVYAGYFRNKYKSVGFVFQNRYKSRLIDKDSYLLECGRYIERNPLRAGITSDIFSYPWSSFSFYANGAGSDIITLVSPLYLELAALDGERQQRYQKYVLEKRPYDHIVDKEFRIR